SGRKTILEQILEQLLLARVPQVTIVTGHRAGEVVALAKRAGVKDVHNPDYARGEMLSSLKAGLAAMPAHVSAALIVLGDQPRIQARVITQVLTAYAEGVGDIVAPSYNRRRGHPILIDRRYWKEIIELPEDGSLRVIMDRYKDHIGYVNVDTDSILGDVDTPDEYREERRRAGLA
ncbi:MAG: NTP transferase domain-containing protein, partial [Anaerolineae bacterium]|nr:NTP transferase domain-containing protein [Anaerolineae bacterium]